MIFNSYKSKQSAMRALRKFGIYAKDAHNFIEYQEPSKIDCIPVPERYVIALDHYDDNDNSLAPVEIPFGISRFMR